MHHAVIQYSCLLVIILFVVMLAQKIKVAYPILLVLVGLPLGFVPFLRGIQIEPDLIFVIFLPPLLYEAAWNTSWKDFWKWRRVISSFAFPVVILTSSAVAFVSAALIPGFTLAAGFLLGGIVSPPDAVSASAILKHIKVPRRFVTIVEGESLLNDASSLVVFRFALAAVLTGTFVFQNAAINFVLVIVMGVGIGLAVALVFYAIHRWLPTSANTDVVLTFMSPYVMYIAAESFHFSGVLAVVSGGLFLSARRHLFLSYHSRIQSVSVWQAVSFVLNGFVFILIGLAFPVVIKNLGADGGLQSAINYSLIITGVLIIGRFICTYAAVVITMVMSKIITVADPNPGWRSPTVLGWTGMRGVVSLAAALSIPLTLTNGAPFPNRDMILFITFSVILVTLVLQGLTLPLVVKWVKMPDPDLTVPMEQQRQLVRKKLAHLSLSILDEHYNDVCKNNGMVQSLVMRYNAEMKLLKDWDKGDNHAREKFYYNDYLKIMAHLLKEQRKLLHALNKKEEISDELVKHQFDLLDLEEEKLHQHFEHAE
ncbi:Na+/H+ antiporter [Mucilaginibacter calamicampi]|uniref:Na+/H+ antiporter n=1 Tax=Mucilaginibacter calamicampi TaxID=1302352 RepID=A0ABW2Z5W6_9SPHI